MTWRDSALQASAKCLCRQIDPADVPCIVCESADSLHVLRPRNAVLADGDGPAVRAEMVRVNKARTARRAKGGVR